MTVKEQLLAAADIIERRGWWNGRPEVSTARQTSCCPVTALAEVTGPGNWIDAGFALLRHLGLHTANGVVVGDLAAWNDRQTDSTVVVGAMRAAAASLA